MKIKELNRIIILSRIIALSVLISTGFSACNNNKQAKLDETPTRGNLSILVDETFFPVVEDAIAVFEHGYKYAKVDIITCPEGEIYDLLLQDTSRVAVLSRDLTAKEEAIFKAKNLIPVKTVLAFDAIALIVNKSVKDSVLSLSNLRQLLEGGGDYSLVFDNSKSSTVRYMMNFMKLDDLPQKGVYSLKSNREVIEYISRNEGSIGFVGLNWLYQPTKDMQEYVDCVKVLGIGDSIYYKPTQETVDARLYPFIREVSLINCQGTIGLGVGVASFIAGDLGQRIILKSGLVPVRHPKREIKIREKL